ncbi:DNA repair protein RecO [Candidatus Nomurabacteria bacterium RIFCSPHIGHO2_01_FULL_38_19]|uniref:DNA repair protein RecO n=1 Tax=Candidatus Nomurabacteria bacterium RIFCSPHIGHO2_01_FULL_38_19 TaxID=1801732 RepID=A0A1F6UTS5_9BACT|nr:MAG: DNA repair protein RecO [Candidatus Nomurabacteria bacterium RIFCSPHIGHO2_01_FULL_38_19]
MHHIYHTEGIVLGSKNSGEAGKYYYIFTRDLGMIHASAQGVRKMSSKLRFVLQDFAYVNVDLVQGRDFWRVTSATKTSQLEKITKRPETFKIFTNIARLLKRLLAGVEPNEALFVDLLGGLSVLEKISVKDAAPAGGQGPASGWRETLHNAEAVMVLRVLNNLGYIGDSPTLKDLIKSPFEESMIFEISKSRNHILRQINKALKETHL